MVILPADQSTLIAMLDVKSIGTIIFCENSGTTYDFSKIQKRAADAGKNLEILIWKGNSNSQRFGKGYGEGEQIEHAINNSQYLPDHVNFYKLTGRNFVQDFENICVTLAERQNVFKIPAWIENTAETRFYKANVLFYKKHLIRSYTETVSLSTYFMMN
jgi:hypothetical protein